ncbi:hypothetical protein EG240_03940 [Paenimyroides tangerinum]|uniref:Lipoprotein n=1 Tax=Paenimyroides tangerinum TaxID=2488728 RepID=A0A3P3W9V3_9FLAO|nr:hypothetical protein [Paenimyroides tangerinum]RRJ91942.1 hypothetical protein EG240_03940 [Paenimyroides tangerinum]
MKKIFSLVFLLTILSCNYFETYEVQPTFENNVNASHAKAKGTTLYSIQNSILNDYYLHYSNDNLNLENVISRLDSITHSNLEFQNLKIVNYSLPTSTEIVTLINNQNYVYDNLNVSVDCKYILDQMINNEIDFDVLSVIINSKNLSQQETELLFYVAENLNDHNDDDWNKSRTVLIVSGYLKQPASAVFNSCLFKILNN